MHTAVEFFELCDRISWRNCDRILKYFNLFIRGPDTVGSNHENKWRSKISWHTPFKLRKWVENFQIRFWSKYCLYILKHRYNKFFNSFKMYRSKKRVNIFVHHIIISVRSKRVHVHIFCCVVNINHSTLSAISNSFRREHNFFEKQKECENASNEQWTRWTAAQLKRVYGTLEQLHMLTFYDNLIFTLQY